MFAFSRLQLLHQVELFPLWLYASVYKMSPPPMKHGTQKIKTQSKSKHRFILQHKWLIVMTWKCKRLKMIFKKQKKSTSLVGTLTLLLLHDLRRASFLLWCQHESLSQTDCEFRHLLYFSRLTAPLFLAHVHVHTVEDGCYVVTPKTTHIPITSIPLFSDINS